MPSNNHRIDHSCNLSRPMAEIFGSDSRRQNGHAAPLHLLLFKPKITVTIEPHHRASASGRASGTVTDRQVSGNSSRHATTKRATDAGSGKTAAAGSGRHRSQSHDPPKSSDKADLKSRQSSRQSSNKADHKADHKSRQSSHQGSHKIDHKSQQSSHQSGHQSGHQSSHQSSHQSDPKSGQKSSHRSSHQSSHQSSQQSDQRQKDTKSSHHSDQHQKDSKSSHKSDHKSDPKSDPKTDLKSGLKSTVRLAGASTHKAVTFAELPQPSYHSLSQTCLMPVYDSYAFGVHQYLRSGARLYEHGPSWC